MREPKTTKREWERIWTQWNQIQPVLASVLSPREVRAISRKFAYRMMLAR